MGFGVSIKHEVKVKVNEAFKDRFVVYIIEAAKRLKWNVESKDKNGFLAYTKFSMSSYGEIVSVKVENEQAIIKSSCTGIQLIDWGKNKRNIKKLLAKIEVVKEEMSEEEIKANILELELNSNVPSEEKLGSKEFEAVSNRFGGISLFIPTKGYFITPILVLLNLLVFVVMIASGVNFMTPLIDDLLSWGAMFRPLILEGEWWRLLTACFIHIGVIHLLFNLYALIYIGQILEPFLGRTKFIAAYLLSGLSASLTSLCWHQLTVGAGASGAIFGMYGVFLALLASKYIDKSVRDAFFMSILMFVGYNIFNGLQQGSGIDNAAHIGGLLSGILIGFAFLPSLKKNENKSLELSTIGLLSLVLLTSSLFLFGNLSNDMGKYETAMKRFVQMEQKAMNIYNLPDDTSDRDYIYEITEIGIPTWKESILMIDSLQELDLPENIVIRNEKLLEYCELRIRSYELIRQAINKNTDMYEFQIADVNAKIENIIEELSK